MRRVFLAVLVGMVAFMGVVQAGDGPPGGAEGVLKIDLLPPGVGNPRNSEGDFVTLKDGRVLFIYTHFTSGANDDSAAHLASRISSDGGRTWSKKDEIVVPNEAGENVMSVSLLRLRDGRIGLFYAQKQAYNDCRPVLRYSADEGESWSEPIKIIPDSEIGYYVINNARVLQLPDGRLLAPVARHDWKNEKTFNSFGKVSCYFSDDGGRTWKHGGPAELAAAHKSVILQEPGLALTVEGKLLLFCRTNGGFQFGCYSDDRGETWGELVPLKLPGPVSPATMERLPGRDEMIVVWNDQKDLPLAQRQKRTPLTIGRATDPSGDWERLMTLEDNPHGWYCYTAMHFVDDALLLGYCAGDTRENNGLAFTRVTRVPLELLVPKGEE